MITEDQIKMLSIYGSVTEAARFVSWVRKGRGINVEWTHASMIEFARTHEHLFAMYMAARRLGVDL